VTLVKGIAQIRREPPRDARRLVDHTG